MKGQRHGRLGGSVLLFAFCSGIVFSSGYSGTCCAGTMSSRKFFLPSDDKKIISDADGESKDNLKSSKKNTVGNNESENAHKSQFVNSKNSKKVKATVRAFDAKDNKHNLEDGISNETSQENILVKPNSEGKLVGKDVIKIKNSKSSLTNNSAILFLSTILASTSVGATSAALRSVFKSVGNKSEPDQNDDPINDDKSDSDENDPNKNDPGKIALEPKDEKSLNLLKTILYTSGSVLVYIVLHYVAKSLFFGGVWYKSERNKTIFYKDIEKLKIPKHPETRALIAYKTNSKEKDNKDERDTIILNFGGNLTNGRDMINTIRVEGKYVFGEPNDEGDFEECKDGKDCKHHHSCRRYVNSKLKYTAASIVPRGYHSNENILKKLGKAGEKALYEDAENLYNYVTGVLGYKNVIIHGFCQGGPVAAHLVKYAEEKAANANQESKVIGLVLTGPQDGVYSSTSKFFSDEKFGGNILSKIAGSILGGISKFLFPFNSLDTYKNLKNIKNKKLPILCLSGKNKDFLSFEKTKIDKRLRDVGFENVTTAMFKEKKHVYIFKEDFIEIITQTENEVIKKFMQPNIKAKEDIIVTDVNGKLIEAAKNGPSVGEAIKEEKIEKRGNFF